MKRILLSSAALLLITISCKKSESTLDASGLIQGKWSFINGYEKRTYMAGISSQDSLVLNPNDSINFQSNDSVYTFTYDTLARYDTSYYSVKKNIILLVNNKSDTTHETVQAISKNSMKLYITKDSADIFIERWYNLTK